VEDGGSYVDRGDCHDQASNAAMVTLADFQEDIARARVCRGMTSQGIFQGLRFGGGPVCLRAQYSVYVSRCGGGKSGLIPKSVRITPNCEAQIALDSIRPRRAPMPQAPALLQNANPDSQMFGAVIPSQQ